MSGKASENFQGIKKSQGVKLRKLAIFQSALMIVQPKSKASDTPTQ
nr:MAG TPA: hypothetical protein [Caudoviricetes sp.]